MTGRVVGMVGVGNMGGGMARRLLDLGWAVTVFDIDEVKVEALTADGAMACLSPAAAAANAQVLIVCVVDAEQTADVLYGPKGAAADMPAG